MLSDIQHDQFGFIKGCIISVIWLSLSRTRCICVKCFPSKSVKKSLLNKWLRN
ncbi:DUF645 family protein [Vibrio cholerae]|uniref:DUF645 family protein n=1 Tax=Vibrio cholerae TaxID=666 RepID=UPI0018A6C436